MQRPARPAIVLDLDQTLITLQTQTHPPINESTQIGQGVWIVKRPYLRRSLVSLSRDFDLYILSAGSQAWVNQAIAAFNLTGLFQAALSMDSVDRLRLRGPWVLVDDLPFDHPNTQRKLQILGDVSPFRLVLAPSFEGSPQDAFLLQLEQHYMQARSTSRSIVNLPPSTANFRR